MLELNRDAQAQMHCETRLSVVDGASHLFEEPGTLNIAAELARDWFVEHMTSVSDPALERTRTLRRESRHGTESDATISCGARCALEAGVAGARDHV